MLNIGTSYWIFASSQVLVRDKVAFSEIHKVKSYLCVKELIQLSRRDCAQVQEIAPFFIRPVVSWIPMLKRVSEHCFWPKSSLMKTSTMHGRSNLTRPSWKLIIVRKRLLHRTRKLRLILNWLVQQPLRTDFRIMCQRLFNLWRRQALKCGFLQEIRSKLLSILVSQLGFLTLKWTNT